MARKSRKQIAKLAEGRCRFCGEDDPAVLDAHRIVPGAEGGGYTHGNMIICCSSCHRKCHAGTIRVDRFYSTTNGRTVLHYFVGDEERWV